MLQNCSNIFGPKSSKTYGENMSLIVLMVQKLQGVIWAIFVKTAQKILCVTTKQHRLI